MYIVKGEEAEPEYLVRDEKVAEVGPAESRAGGAVTIRVEWPGIRAKLGALDVQPPVSREDRAIPPHPGRRHAVNQVNPSANRFDEILGKAYAHQITGMRFRKGLVHDLDHLVHRVLIFAH